jgi:hypothetical protein
MSEDAGVANDQARIAPTDIVAVVRHVTHLASDLEKVWSDALDVAALHAANQSLGTRLEVTLAALASRLDAQDAKLQQAGLDVMLPDWPPSAEFVLGEDPADPQARWRLVMVAQLQAFELLVEAANALTEPSGVSTDLLRDHEERRWWEGGAFALLRSRARLVERLTYELEAAEAALLAGDRRRRDEAYEAFDLAATAYRRGDPESALFHGIRCATLCVGGRRSACEEDLWASLRARQDRASLADLLDRAQVVVGEYGSGQPVGHAMPLASVLLPRLHRLVMDAPATRED